MINLIVSLKNLRCIRPAHKEITIKDALGLIEIQLLVLQISLDLRCSSRTQNSLYVKIIDLTLVLRLPLLEALNLVDSIQFLLNYTLFECIVFNHFMIESLLIIHPVLDSYNLVLVLNDVVLVVCEWIINVFYYVLDVLGGSVRVVFYHERFLSLALFHLVLFSLYVVPFQQLVER